MKAPETRALWSVVGVALCLLALLLPAAMADEAAVAREQHAHEAKLLVAHGRQLLASKAYAEARDAFRKALALAPGDDACARLLAQTERALGLTADKGVLEQAKERRESTARFMTVQFDTALFEAEREMAANPDRAAQRARRVLEGVPHLHDAGRAAELKLRAQAVLAKATAESQRRLDQFRRRDLARVKADASTRADAQAARLRALRDEGREHLGQGNQEKALEAAEAMLRIAPGHPDALKLQDDIQLTRLPSRSLRGRSELRKQRDTELLRELDREMLAPEPGKVVVAGKNKKRRPAARGLLERPMEPWERELRARLEEPIDMEFRGTPLDQAVRQIADVAGINIIVDPEADARKTPVHISRSRMPLGSLLRWVGRFASLDYSLRDGAVVLARPGGCLDEPVRRSYNVSSLVTPPNEARPLPDIGPVEPTPVAATAPAPPEDVNPDVVGQGWVDYLRSTIAPETWGRALQDAPTYTIAYRNGRIVVVHTPEVHRQVEELLNNFRKARSLQVHLLGRFIELTTGYLDAFNLEFFADSDGDLENDNPNYRLFGGATNLNERENLTRFPNFFAGGGGLNLQYSYLGDDNLSVLLQAVVKKRKGTILTAPRLTCFNTQRANIQVLINYNYVRRITTDDEPEIGNVPEGVIFDVQPFVSADRRYITLILQPQIRELVSLATYHYATEVQIIDQGGVAVAFVQESYVQLPTTRLKSLGTTVTTPNGGTLMVGGFSEVEERHALAGIPFVENIPLLGRLLRGWDRAEGRRSLIMLITAETVPDVFSEEEG